MNLNIKSTSKGKLHIYLHVCNQLLAWLIISSDILFFFLIIGISVFFIWL